jgi:hypothetical protein
MINKILAMVAAGAVATCSIPAAAQERFSDREHRVERHDRDDRNRDRRGGIDTGEAIAIGLGALLLGAIISDGDILDNDRDRRRYRDRHYRPYSYNDRGWREHRRDREHYCVREQKTYWHNGHRHTYWEKRCNY